MRYGGLSAGAYFAILAFGLLGAYAVAGMAYGRWKHGRFAHPHAACAGGFFRMCGDGITFSLNGCHLLPASQARQGLRGADANSAGKGNVFMVGAKKAAGTTGGHIEGEANAIVTADDQENPGYQSI